MKRLIRLFPLILLVVLSASGVKALDARLDFNPQPTQFEHSVQANTITLLAQQAIPQQSLEAANQLKIIVKEIAPDAQETELQIVSLFKHKATGDTLISAAATLDQALGGFITKQGLAQPFTIHEWVCEAGSVFYAEVISQVKQAIERTNTQIASRTSTPYVTGR